jgi:hypothetical protein
MITVADIDSEYFDESCVDFSHNFIRNLAISFTEMIERYRHQLVKADKTIFQQTIDIIRVYG